jgi:hypothetical protein
MFSGGLIADRKLPVQKQLEHQFIARWPGWFHVQGDVHHTLVSLKFEHEDGWFNIVWRLCTDLEPLVAKLEEQTGLTFKILQVNEKFGELRFYPNHINDAISKRIEVAEQESARTCELCGQPGTRQDGGWVRIRCEEHAAI